MPGLQSDDSYLAAYAPGLRPDPVISGYARRVKAGSRLIFNVHYTPDGTQHRDTSYVGVKFADQKSLSQIAQEAGSLIDKARTKKIQPQEFTGNTFTISNLGMFGVDAFSAIITPPQAAVLAVGRIADRVVPVHGLIGIRPILTMTLSSDHRVVDGAQAAAFLKDLAEALTSPQLT